MAQKSKALRPLRGHQWIIWTRSRSLAKRDQRTGGRGVMSGKGDGVCARVSISFSSSPSTEFCQLREAVPSEMQCRPDPRRMAALSGPDATLSAWSPVRPSVPVLASMWAREGPCSGPCLPDSPFQARTSSPSFVRALVRSTSSLITGQWPRPMTRPGGEIYSAGPSQVSLLSRIRTACL